jgi:5'-nucleotidase
VAGQALEVLVRILVTNDDGVRAPGIAALARVAREHADDVVVVAPMVDYSGSSAAVGPVHSRDGVDYESFVIEGLPHVPAYGIDGPPALAVILACVGGFGPLPDLVLSGINNGANVGRSAMHSGTVGAAMTAAHFGLRSLAVSIKYGEDPVPWETPSAIAAALIDVLAGSPAGTTLNLNVPNVALGELRGIRHGRLGRGGAIRSAVHGTGASHMPHVALPPLPSGTLRLDLTPAGTTSDAGPDTDAGLIARGYASLTALVGVREAGLEARLTMDDALGAVSELAEIGSGGNEEPEEPEGDTATG